MNVYITLDYELFLGTKTGTPENCLVRPMNELCKVADRFDFKYIIFVDAAYLLRMYQLKEAFPQLQKDYDLVSNHVKSLYGQGHNIQLHFHPQWLYSDYNDNLNVWNLDMKHYKLSDMEDGFAFASFHEAKQLLDDIIGTKTTGFRAGGFCLDTFTEFPRLFRENGILYDSSVARFQKENSPTHVYDYSLIPEQEVYNFTSSLIKEDKGGCFTEYSISSIKCSLIEYVFTVRKLLRDYHPSAVFKDGISTAEVENVRFIERLKDLIKGKTYVASIDGMSSQLLEKVFDYYLLKKKSHLILLGHPKLISDVSVKNLSDALQKFSAQIVLNKELRYGV